MLPNIWQPIVLNNSWRFRVCVVPTFRKGSPYTEVVSSVLCCFISSKGVRLVKRGRNPGGASSTPPQTPVHPVHPCSYCAAPSGLVAFFGTSHPALTHRAIACRPSRGFEMGRGGTRPSRRYSAWPSDGSARALACRLGRPAQGSFGAALLANGKDNCRPETTISKLDIPCSVPGSQCSVFGSFLSRLRVR